MALPRPSDRAASASLAGHGAPTPLRLTPAAGGRIDWDDWTRRVERRRRALARANGGADGYPLPLPRDFYHAATCVSFRLDGLSATGHEVADALAPGAAGKACRSRQTQRIRHHAAVLRHAQLLLRRGRPLQPDDVIRWYASISCGLSTNEPDDPTRHRLAAIVVRVNSPQMRLRPAVEDVAQLHQRLLADAFVPAFNGILARVLLHYHLSRCGLPTVLFDPDVDRTPFPDETSLTRRLMQLIAARYDAIATSQ